MGACSLAALSRFSTVVPFLIISIFFGLSLSVVTSATAAYIADLSKKEACGSAMGMLGSVMDIGHTTGPLAAGFIASSSGLRMSFVVRPLSLSRQPSFRPHDDRDEAENEVSCLI
ncbi:MAG: MFS transporter [Nitrospirae bacterium]|nr:MFS transporter [Nitrospirota bacterium]